MKNRPHLSRVVAGTGTKGPPFGPGWCHERGPKGPWSRVKPPPGTNGCFGGPRRKCACGPPLVPGGCNNRDNWGPFFILAPKFWAISFFRFFFICLFKIGYQLVEKNYEFKNYQTMFLYLFRFYMSSKNIAFYLSDRTHNLYNFIHIILFILTMQICIK